MRLCERKKNFIKTLYTNFISKFINIDFWQICHFDMKGTGWVGLELTIIFTQTVRVWYVSEPLYRYTNIGKTEIFHV